MNKYIWIGIYTASLGLFLVIALPIVIGFGFFGNYMLDYMFDFIRGHNITFNNVLLVIYLIVFLAYMQFALVHFICNLVTLAKMWSSIQDGQTPITVGKAIGFLFIPVFSLYWVCRVWGSFPAEYENFTKRRRLNLPRPSSSIFIAYPVLLLIFPVFPVVIGFLGIFISRGLGLYFWPYFVLIGGLVISLLGLSLVFMGVMAKAFNAANALPRITPQRQNPAIKPVVIQPNQLSANYH